MSVSFRAKRPPVAEGRPSTTTVSSISIIPVVVTIRVASAQETRGDKHLNDLDRNSATYRDIISHTRVHSTRESRSAEPHVSIMTLELSPRAPLARPAADPLIVRLPLRNTHTRVFRTPVHVYGRKYAYRVTQTLLVCSAIRCENIHLFRQPCRSIIRRVRVYVGTGLCVPNETVVCPLNKPATFGFHVTGTRNRAPATTLWRWYDPKRLEIQFATLRYKHENN